VEGTSYIAKLDILVNLNLQLLPLFFEELQKDFPSKDRSVVMARTISAIKETSGIFTKRNEAELEDELNPHSPKFSIAIQWVLEAFHKALVEQGIEDLTIENVFRELSSHLDDYEEKLLKAFKGITNKSVDLARARNPFVADFMGSVSSKNKGE
jgi:chorismate mutase